MSLGYSIILQLPSVNFCTELVENKRCVNCNLFLYQQTLNFKRNVILHARFCYPTTLILSIQHLLFIANVKECFEVIQC